jgi:hypothetical protein
MAKHPYHRLSTAEKEAYARGGIREPAIACPVCDVQTTPADLLPHLDARCPGPREPHQGSRWISRREAMAMGVPRETLQYWVRQGRVRATGERHQRRYLLRDLVRRIAMRRL